MIRPFTCLCLVAACGSGLYLYSEKHRTALLDREIGRVIRATEAARAQTGLLHAEWALLNEPGRLQDMAEKYTALKPMAPTQFVQLADLAAHLPQAVAPGAAGANDAAGSADAAGGADQGEAPASPPAIPLASAAPDAEVAPPPAPLEKLPARHPMLPAAKAEGQAPMRLAARPPAQHHIAVADRQDSPHDTLLAHGTPLPLAAPRPMGATVYSAMARPMRAPAAHPAVVGAVPRYATAAPIVTSSLGGRASLPPPVPYGQ